MNKKLRLLVTDKCGRNCPLCCNKAWDIDDIPVVGRFDYEQIMITGGEPLLYPQRIFELVDSIEMVLSVQGNPRPQFYVYTAISDWMAWDEVIYYVDGVVLTLHEQKDVPAFMELNDYLLRLPISRERSLRLNVFKNITLPEMDLSLWQTKQMEWLKDCPVPKGEDFRRIAALWVVN